MNNNATNVRWFYLITGVLALLFSGIIYAWSILKEPLALEFGWTVPQLSLNYTLTMSFFCLGGILGSVLGRRWGVRMVILLAALCACWGLIAVSRMTGGNVLTLYLSYGVLCSLGIGMAYNTVLTTVCAWFPDKLGLCSGCLMMGFGASAMVVGSVGNAMINAPEIGWRTAYACLGGALGAVLLLAALVLHRPPEHGYGAEQPAAPGAPRPEGADSSPAQMLKNPVFWFSFFYIMFLSAVGSTIISFAKDISVSMGAGAALSAALVGVLSICNGLGRVIAGAAVDKLGQRVVMIAANIIAFAAVLLVLLALVFSSLHVGVLGLCLTGVSYGTNPSISSTLVAGFFGKRYFSSNLSIMGVNLMGAAGIASVAGVLYSYARSYIAPVLLLIIMTAVGFGLNLAVWKLHGRQEMSDG